MKIKGPTNGLLGALKNIRFFMVWTPISCTMSKVLGDYKLKSTMCIYRGKHTSSR